MKVKHYTLYYMGRQVSVCQGANAYANERVGSWDWPTCQACRDLLWFAGQGRYANTSSLLFYAAGEYFAREHEL